jgi:hypothetical protein
MPEMLFYCRCEQPLTVEVDRIRRGVRDNSIQYSIYDSVAFACDGPPEAAEVASRYFRAVREIGGGSLHIAHTNRSEQNDQKPFGSTFWHNGARSTWFIQAAEPGADDTLRLGLFNRKSNLGPLRPALGYAATFTRDRTTFQTADISSIPEFAGRLSVRKRMISLLKRGAMSPEAIALEIEANIETVKREARRNKDTFLVLDDGSIGLLGETADKSGQVGQLSGDKAADNSPPL